MLGAPLVLAGVRHLDHRRAGEHERGAEHGRAAA
jgi:hypothetical protein